MKQSKPISGGPYFRYFNNNPFGYYTTDCVVRSMSCFFDKGWAEMYSELSLWGIGHGLMFNWPQCYGKYLEGKGVKRLPFKKSKNRSLNTVGAFVKGADKSKRYLIQTSRHLTVIVDGLIRDIGDCSHLVVQRVWEM